MVPGAMSIPNADIQRIIPDRPHHRVRSATIKTRTSKGPSFFYDVSYYDTTDSLVVQTFLFFRILLLAESLLLLGSQIISHPRVNTQNMQPTQMIVILYAAYAAGPINSTKPMEAMGRAIESEVSWFKPGGSILERPGRCLRPKSRFSGVSRKEYGRTDHKDRSHRLFLGVPGGTPNVSCQEFSCFSYKPLR